MNRKEKVNGKMAFIGVLLLCLIFAGYFYLRGKESEKTNLKKTEVEQILNMDLVNNYPETPTSVIKLYCRINKYLYNNKAKNEEEVDELIDILRNLYSEEFLVNNPRDTNLKDFKEEIAQYKKDQRKIMTYQLQSKELIETWTDKDGTECANLVALFNISQKEERIKLYERVALIKDSEGNWKIHGWKVSPEVDMGTVDNQ